MGKLNETRQLVGVEQISKPKRLQCLARRHDAVDHVPVEEPVEAGDLVIGEVIVFAISA